MDRPKSLMIVIAASLMIVGAGCGTAKNNANENTNSAAVNSANTNQVTLPPGFITVEWRATPVNVSDLRWQYQLTAKGLILRQAWYDAGEKYLIVGTSKTYWQYCGVSTETWTRFNSTTSYDSLVNSEFKRTFLCTSDNVPLYADEAVTAGYTRPTAGSDIIELRQFIGDEDCVVGEYCEAENENGQTEDVYIYRAEGDHLLGIAEDDIAVEVRVVP